MPRKSRKNLVDIDNNKCNLITSNNEEKIFKTAIYTRLSVENSGKSEDKEVMKNQIEYCKDYIKDKTNLKLVDIYVDDGYTGTNFNRPEFKRLMEDIKQNKVDAIIIRDLSRFSRSYIETGVYIEKILPNIGVRLISINEKFDSFTIDNSKEELMIPLQNIINDFYSKDISRKVSTVLRNKMKKGTYKGHNLPYGYKWNEERNQIIIDEITAPFVKLIFKWKIEGLSKAEIIKKLKELNAPNPEYRKNDNGVRNTKKTNATNWSKTTVYGILSNEAYIGNTISGKKYQAKYKGVDKAIVVNKNDHFIFKNTHEAIISNEDFVKVINILKTASEKRNEKMKKSKKARDEIINLFENKIYCGDCGNKMYFTKYETKNNKQWKAYYKCSGNIRKLNTTCSSHIIQEKELQENILNAIKLQVKAGIDYEKLLIKLKNSECENNIREKQQNDILSLKLKISNMKKKRTKLYEDFIDGLIDERDYKFTKVSFDEEFNKLNEILEKIISRQISFNDKWIKSVKSISRSKKLTQILVDNVIEEVRIYEDKKIEIIMKYDDIY